MGREGEQLRAPSTPLSLRTPLTDGSLTAPSSPQSTPSQKEKRSNKTQLPHPITLGKTCRDGRNETNRRRRAETSNVCLSAGTARPPRPGGNGGGSETRRPGPRYLSSRRSQRTGRGAPNKPFGQPVIGRFMSLLVTWNPGRASKGPRNKHHNNTIVRFGPKSLRGLPSSAESSTTKKRSPSIPILRACNQQARRPGCGPAGGANTTARTGDGTATTSNRTNKEPFVRSEETNATSDGIKKRSSVADAALAAS
jgi:hypothetical protein